MIAFRAGVLRQLVALRRIPDYLTFIALGPLSTLMFLAVVRSVGRPDLGAATFIGVSIIVGWQTGLFLSGDTLQLARFEGTLELDVASPADVTTAMAGRVVVAGAYTLLPFGLNLATVQLVHGSQAVSIDDPLAFSLVLLASWPAMAAALMMMASVTILSGRSVALTNGLSYPLFLIAGVIVPTSYLPDLAERVSVVLFMRWTAEGLRNAALGTGDGVGTPVVALLISSAAMFALGVVLLRTVVRRARESGSVYQL